MILREKIITINKNKYMYNGENKHLKDIINKVKKNKKANFIILDEELYIKEYYTIKKTEVKNIINNEVKNEFNNDDYLIHFDIDRKNNKTFIYAIKGGNKIDPFIRYVRKIKVNPIQFILIKFLKEKIKKRDFKSLVDVNGKYYFIKVSNGFIIKSSIHLSNEEFFLLKDIILAKFEFPYKKQNLIIGEM